MFTGLVETTGSVEAFRGGAEGARIRIRAPRVAPDLRVGESIAVDGVCLTVVAADRTGFETELAPETIRRTVFAQRREGDKVNLERAVRASDRLGGHLVQGHVDGVAEVVSVEPEGEGMRARLRVAPDLDRYIVEKGSVALDGVSLTVAGRDASGFEVALIPHTLKETTLSEWRPGRRVHVEVDLVAKYVERLLEAWRQQMRPAAAGDEG
jgi:riboflavin synthase